jgi:hypothetical protein
VTEAPTPPLPSLAEALAWTGLALDDVDGAQVGRVAGVYADVGAGAPIWLTVVLAGSGRRLPLFRRRPRVVVVPLRECAAMPGRVWTAQGGERIRAAPTVDPGRPLLRDHELTICLHYRIGEQVGRHAEIAGRAPNAITAQPFS